MAEDAYNSLTLRADVIATRKAVFVHEDNWEQETQWFEKMIHESSK